MKSGLIIHPRTEKQLAAFISRPAQSVLFVGPDGVGKGMLAREAIAGALSLTPDTLGGQAYFLAIGADGATISIDAVRNIRQFLQLKTAGSRAVRRAVLIEHGDTLTTEAQNALLKLLEEPPADTILAITASHPRALLPTITSRVQTITVHAPDEQTMRDYFAQHAGSPAALSQAYFLSGGLPGLMHALLEKGETHPLLAGVDEAKALLRESTFGRLAQTERLSKQKDAARQTIDALARMAQAGISQAARQSDEAKLKQWHRVLAQTDQAQRALQANANTKIALTNLMLQL